MIQRIDGSSRRPVKQSRACSFQLVLVAVAWAAILSLASCDPSAERLGEFNQVLPDASIGARALAREQLTLVIHATFACPLLTSRGLILGSDMLGTPIRTAEQEHHSMSEADPYADCTPTSI